MTKSHHEMEERIWDAGILQQDADSLRELMAYLADQFASYLGRSIEVVHINVEVGIGANCSVYVRRRQEVPIEIEWDCMIHMRLPEDHEEPLTQVYASLLGFASDRRIGLQEHDGQSVMYLRYRKVDSSIGAWCESTWQCDDYGEWEANVNPTWADVD